MNARFVEIIATTRRWLPGWSLVLNSLSVIALFLGLLFAGIQINDLRRVNAAQISIDLTRDIYSTESYKDNLSIMKLIGRKQPILKENGGRYDDEDLDNIIGTWDLISRL